MYAGVSAEDCLFAEIGFDPSRPGSQTVEATDLLLRNRPLLTHSHVIIFQVGCVGLTGFNFKGFQNVHLDVLVDRLEKEYGENHPVVAFRDSQFRVFRSAVDRYQIRDLRKPEVQKRITGITTFYLPPKSLLRTDLEVAKQFGLKPVSGKPLSGPYQIDHPYSNRDLAAVKALDSHTLPKNYKRLRASPAMHAVMQKLALDPRAQASFLKSPMTFTSALREILPQERKALLSGRSYAVNSSMKATSASVAEEFVQASLRIPTLSRLWATQLKNTRDKLCGDEILQVWLKQRGYDTTLADINEAWASQGIGVFAVTYTTQIDGKSGPPLIIRKTSVTLGQQKIKGYSFAQNVLSWDQSEGNASSASINLVLVIDNGGKPLPPGSYIGPWFTGTYTDSSCSNVTFVGRVGDLPTTGGADSTQLEQYDAVYNTYVKDASGKFTKDTALVVKHPNVTYKGKALRNIKWANSTLSVVTVDGNLFSMSIYFYHNKSTKANPVLGYQFFGRRWAVGESPPNECNFMGQIGHPTYPDLQAKNASSVLLLKIAAISIAEGAASMFLARSTENSTRLIKRRMMLRRSRRGCLRKIVM